MAVDVFLEKRKQMAGNVFIENAGMLLWWASFYKAEEREGYQVSLFRLLKLLARRFSFLLIWRCGEFIFCCVSSLQMHATKVGKNICCGWGCWQRRLFFQRNLNLGLQLMCRQPISFLASDSCRISFVCVGDGSALKERIRNPLF